MAQDMKSMMKWPLILAVILIVVRIPLERLGAPEPVNNLFGVAWLYFLVPVYFAYRIAARGGPSPYKELFKSLLTFSTITRLMVIPTYWLAYALQWTAPRFTLKMGGVVGEGVTPLQGYVWIPIRNAVIWIVLATILGMIIGGVTLLLKRRGGERQPAAG